MTTHPMSRLDMPNFSWTTGRAGPTIGMANRLTNVVVITMFKPWLNCRRPMSVNKASKQRGKSFVPLVKWHHNVDFPSRVTLGICLFVVLAL